MTKVIIWRFLWHVQIASKKGTKYSYQLVRRCTLCQSDLVYSVCLSRTCHQIALSSDCFPKIFLTVMIGCEYFGFSFYKNHWKQAVNSGYRIPSWSNILFYWVRLQNNSLFHTKFPNEPANTVQYWLWTLELKYQIQGTTQRGIDRDNLVWISYTSALLALGRGEWTAHDRIGMWRGVAVNSACHFRKHFPGLSMYNKLVSVPTLFYSWNLESRIVEDDKLLSFLSTSVQFAAVNPTEWHLMTCVGQVAHDTLQHTAENKNKNYYKGTYKVLWKRSSFC